MKEMKLYVNGLAVFSLLIFLPSILIAEVPKPPVLEGGSGVPNSSPRQWENLLSDAKGFAENVSGGAGAQLITVTNLNDTGAGSLPAATETQGAKWIRFQSGLRGTISLGQAITLTSNTTIDGRGADITIERPNDVNGNGAAVYAADAENIILAYLKIGPARIDTIRLFQNVNGIWLHHLTLQGAGDELIDINSRINNVTVSWCHLYNAKYAILTDGSIAKEMISKYTFHHNFFDGVNERLPIVRSSLAHVYNNYTRGWSWGSTTASEYSEVYWENNIADAAGANNKKAAFSGGSSSSFPMGILKSVGSHMLVNGAYVEEMDRERVFDPGNYYAHSADVANEELRNRLMTQAGWIDVPFPE